MLVEYQSINAHLSLSWLDGTDPKVVVEGRGQEPFGLDVHEEHVYWTDWTTYSVWRVRMIFTDLQHFPALDSIPSNLGGNGRVAKNPRKNAKLLKF